MRRTTDVANRTNKLPYCVREFRHTSSNLGHPQRTPTGKAVVYRGFGRDVDETRGKPRALKISQEYRAQGCAFDLGFGVEVG